ncbi:CDP-diacylglycerol--glycerol-3-phosphate 3-phosphatidyltransferase [Oscillospiraceae bacterium OttesenSCG-928-F05]|nr:CDP-diacylglycerol--glycerol-3-phosphate 3-phosphatidyltransferase [Oscillospiraceae bacterium OttesenSCG-928-F05]
MNIPNLLSLFRLMLIPVFVAAFFSGGPNAYKYAACVFLFASATDVLDGFIARKFNKITKLGRILDPLADKLMTATVLVCIVIGEILPVWVICVFVAKELLMLIGGLFMYGRVKDVMASNVFGKAATVSFFLVCMALMLFPVPEWAATLMISVALGLTVLSLVIYGIQMFRLIGKEK